MKSSIENQPGCIAGTSEGGNLPGGTVNRAAFVTEARSWIGTPYVLGAGVKGAGVDCARLIAECLVNCGLADRADLGVYAQDWFCHTSEQHYKMRLLRNIKKTVQMVARELRAFRYTDVPDGVIALKRCNSELWNHGGIVTHWPLLVHANQDGVLEIDASRDPMWAGREFTIFDPFAGM